MAQIVENGKLGGIGKTKKEATENLQEELNAMYDRLKSITGQNTEIKIGAAPSVITLADFIRTGLGCNMSEAKEEAMHCASFFSALIRADGDRNGKAEETSN